jgi:hypothetical protein
MKNIFLIATCFLTICDGTALAGKQEKKNKVKTTTVIQTIHEDGKQVTYKESTESFDKSGNTTLFIEYGKAGSISKKETFAYDKYGNVMEETSFNAQTKTTIRKTYRYTVIKDKMPLAEESEYNEAGSLIKKTSFTYNAIGKKATETVTDSSGNLISKSTFHYNSRDLKTQKQTVNRLNKPESEKEWQYEYY